MQTESYFSPPLSDRCLVRALFGQKKRKRYLGSFLCHFSMVCFQIFPSVPWTLWHTFQLIHLMGNRSVVLSQCWKKCPTFWWMGSFPFIVLMWAIFKCLPFQIDLSSVSRSGAPVAYNHILFLPFQLLSMLQLCKKIPDVSIRRVVSCWVVHKQSLWSNIFGIACLWLLLMWIWCGSGCHVSSHLQQTQKLLWGMISL